MADQTAEQFKQAAADFEQQRKALFQQFDAIREKQEALRRSILAYNKVITNPNSTPEQKAEAQQQKAAAEAEIKELDSQAAQIEAQADALRDKRDEALANARTAEANQASTRENNAGTGQPGTAGQGATATPDAEQRAAEAQPPAVDPNTLTTPDGEVEAGTQADTGLTEPPITDDPGINGLDLAGSGAEGGGDELGGGVADNPGTAPPNGATQGLKSKAQSTATAQDTVSFQKAKDWRVRLSLAPSAKYLYAAANPGILKPLAATNGVIFPYTPNVSVVYAANYDSSELVHSNYKIYNYKNSSVDTVTITSDFTAQDTVEANYLLAVIHFFRSVTKMFYGRDENPRNGVPPPLCFLSGLGTFQFDNHPLVITNFTYTLPTEVDYIRAGSQTNNPGQNTGQQTAPNNVDSSSQARIESSGLTRKAPNFQRQATTINSDATYVPTKMQITITCTPIVTRNDISNTFSLEKYATGALLQGSKRNGGGIW